MGLLIQTILDKKSPKKTKEDSDEKESDVEDEDESGDELVMSQELIDAVKADDAEGVLAALRALKEVLW